MSEPMEAALKIVRGKTFEELEKDSLTLHRKVRRDLYDWHIGDPWYVRMRIGWLIEESINQSKKTIRRRIRDRRRRAKFFLTPNTPTTTD